MFTDKLSLLNRAVKLSIYLYFFWKCKKKIPTRLGIDVRTGSRSVQNRITITHNYARRQRRARQHTHRNRATVVVTCCRPTTFLPRSSSDATSGGDVSHMVLPVLFRHRGHRAVVRTYHRHRAHLKFSIMNLLSRTAALCAIVIGIARSTSKTQAHAYNHHYRLSTMSMYVWPFRYYRDYGQRKRSLAFSPPKKKGSIYNPTRVLCA